MKQGNKLNCLISKIATSLVSSLLAMTIVSPAYAQNIFVDRPTRGFTTLGDAVSKVIAVTFAIAIILVLVMLILGAFEWITSGGDKEAVGKARGRILNALIGLAILAVSFALANVAARFTGMDLFNITVPTPNPAATGL